MFKGWKLVAVAAVLLAVAPGCSGMKAPKRVRVAGKEEKTVRFPAKNIRVVAVAEINGGVSISFGGQDDVVVTTTKVWSVPRGADGAGFAAGFGVDAAFSGGELRLRGRYPKTMGAGFSGWTHFSVVAPEGMSVRVDTINGNVVIGPGASRVRVRTEMGNVTVSGAGGAVEVHGRQGDVSVAGSAGPADISTVNGGVRFVSPAPAGDISIKTVGGDIDFALEAGAGAELRVRTQNGDIRNTLPLVSARRGRGSLDGVCGGGGRKVRLEAINGEIKTGPAPRAMPPGSA